MNTAVVDFGNFGSRLAKNLTAGGQKIIVVAKTLANAKKLARDLGSDAEAGAHYAYRVDGSFDPASGHRFNRNMVLI